jgi:hypothetical protein
MTVERQLSEEHGPGSAYGLGPTVITERPARHQDAA